MNQEELHEILNGDDSSIRKVGFENKLAVLSLFGAGGVLAFSYLISMTGIFSSFFPILIVLIPIGYGLYLGLTNQAVYYSSKKDLLSVLAILVLPICLLFLLHIIFGDSSKTIDAIIKFLFMGSLIASLVWFGTKTANVNASLNAELPLYKIVAVLLSKIFLVYIFLFALFSQVSRVIDGQNTKKNATTYRQYHQGKNQVANGALWVVILSAIGTWLYFRVINLEKVMDQRGIDCSEAENTLQHKQESQNPAEEAVEPNQKHIDFIKTEFPLPFSLGFNPKINAFKVVIKNVENYSDRELKETITRFLTLLRSNYPDAIIKSKDKKTYWIKL